MHQYYNKFDFEIQSTAIDYYQRLERSDAYLLERKFNKSLSNQQTSATSLLTAIEVKKLSFSFSDTL